MLRLQNVITILSYFKKNAPVNFSYYSITIIGSTYMSLKVMAIY